MCIIIFILCIVTLAIAIYPRLAKNQNFSIFPWIIVTCINYPCMMHGFITLHH